MRRLGRARGIEASRQRDDPECGACHRSQRLYRVSRYGTGIRTLAPTLLALVPAIAACGDNSSPCDFTEASDATNATVAEITGLVLGDRVQHVCGGFDAQHFTSATKSADDDRYRLSVGPAAAPLLVDVWVGDGLAVLAGVTVRVFDTAATPRLIAEVTPKIDAVTSHGAFLVALEQGDYEVVVSADADGMIAGDAIAYRLRFAPMPSCDATTAAANYTEASASSEANDTIAVDYTKDPQFAAIPATHPEASGLGIVAGHSYAIVGAIDDQPRSDLYLDRDTYELTTGDTTNELAIRLGWDGVTSDLDYLVFEAATMVPVVASNLSTTTGPELAMFGVKPSTKYWLWIGGFAGSTATTYRATICGQHYFY
jgi:hypothetical protein